MKRYRVEFSPEAVGQAQQIQRWWQENRPAAPDLFGDEIAAAVERLSSAPASGAPYQRSRLAGVRRLLLPRTRYHVYYTVDDVVALVHNPQQGELLMDVCTGCQAYVERGRYTHMALFSPSEVADAFIGSEDSAASRRAVREHTLSVYKYFSTTASGA